jgi:hypothetical protein
MLARCTFVSDRRHLKVLTELIAERFGIGPITAQKTLQLTTQRGIRSTILQITRRYWAECVFGVKRLNGKFSINTACGKIQFLQSNISQLTIILPHMWIQSVLPHSENQWQPRSWRYAQRRSLAATTLMHPNT